jgi:PKD repeat protein
MVAAASTSLPGAATTGRSSGAVGDVDLLTITAADHGEYALYVFHPANVPDQIGLLVDSGQTSSYWLALANYATQHWEMRGPFTANGIYPLGSDYLSPLGNAGVAVLVAPHEHATVMAVTFVAENGAPTAALQAQPDSGTAPLTVDFDASGSNDPEGAIVNYEWEFSAGAGFSSTGGTAVTQHVYSAAGDYTATVRVTDSADQQATKSVTVSVGPGNSPPTAALILPPAQPAPYTAHLDGSSSSDSDGTVVKFEWDMDGDGIFETDTGATSSLDFNVPAPGLYPVALRVTDDDGSTDTAAGNVRGTGWVKVNFPSDTVLGYESALAAVNGHPAIATTAVNSVSAQLELCYMTASTTLGTALADWSAPVTLAPGSVDKVDLRLVNGKPVATSIVGNELRYSAASTLDGSQAADWTTVTVEASVGNVWPAALATVQGHPALAYCSANDHLHYVRSASASGLSAGDWAGVLDLDGGAYIVQEGCSLAVIDGNPAIAYNNITDLSLLYVRSTTATGEALADWSQRATLTPPNLGYGGSLLEIEGHPTLAYLPFGPGLHIGWASTATGADSADWQTFQVCPNTGNSGYSAHLEIVGGRPAVASFSDGGNVLVTHAANPTGAQAADWPDTCEKAGETSRTYSPPGLADVGGHIAVTYHDWQSDGLQYALLYE